MVIETKDLTKIYGKKIGCEKICLSVAEGQIFGFLGPNGAGKSTLVKMLVGLIKPTSGSATILDAPLGDVFTRRRIGFLPENFRYQDWLTGRELLRYHGRLAKLSRRSASARADETLRLVGLSADADTKIRTYSKGMQQRIGLASALVSDPDLLLLDEPTSALDPLGRKEVREIIAKLKEQGKTVFLNSHLLGEVEMVCDQVAIIKKGRVAESGDLQHLLKGKVEVEVLAKNLNGIAQREIAKLAKIVEHNGERLLIECADEETLPVLAKLIVDNGGNLYQLNLKKRTLEELFVDVVTESERD